jgi:hypothetical protein
MKYLCLIYHDEACVASLPATEYEAVMADVEDYQEELQASGYYISSAPLQAAHTATTIRVRNGRMLMTDGPFAETNEQLGGFYLIDATDLNDAIRVAARMPSARIGSVEVRPLRDNEVQRSPIHHQREHSPS